MLRKCGRYSLILFLHGHCQHEVDHVYRWERQLAQLARSGFVIAAPFHSNIGSGPLGDSLLESSIEVLQWMRNSWPGRAEPYPPLAPGVFGHSYGAMLAARVAITADIMAYGSLSANWHEWSSLGPGIPEPLPKVNCKDTARARSTVPAGNRNLAPSRASLRPRGARIPQHRGHMSEPRPVRVEAATAMDEIFRA